MYHSINLLIKMLMAKFNFSRFKEIADMCATLIKILISIAADIVDDGRINGSNSDNS